MAVNQSLFYATTIMNPKFNQVLEFGVFKGKTIRQLRKTLGDQWEIYGFDSFEGLPEDWEGTTQLKGGLSSQGIIPDIPRVVFMKGWFEETIPEYLLTHTKPIALLHIDCDLYSSTCTILKLLNHLIVPGTVLVFDEWYYNHLNIPENRQHEQKAFYEWISETNRDYELIPAMEDERQVVIIKETLTQNQLPLAIPVD